MKIDNPALLRSLRGPGLCEVCGKPCRRREVAHVRAKGLGGGHRLDVPLNCVSCGEGLWGTGECFCHAAEHYTGGDVLLRIVAKREGVAPEEVKHALDVLDRIPKDASQAQLERELDGVPATVARLVCRELATVLDYWRKIEPLPEWDACKTEPPF